MHPEEALFGYYSLQAPWLVPANVPEVLCVFFREQLLSLSWLDLADWRTARPGRSGLLAASVRCRSRFECFPVCSMVDKVNTNSFR